MKGKLWEHHFSQKGVQLRNLLRKFVLIMGLKEEAVGLLRYLVLLSDQNKLQTLMTVLSEMVYFKTVELHQEEWSLEWQHAVKQGKPGWGLNHLQRDSFHAHALELDFTLNLVKPGDWEELTARGSTVTFVVLRWGCPVAWSRADLAHRAMCAWFFCLLLNIYSSMLLNSILKCKAVFCLQGALGEMLSVSVAGNLHPVLSPAY